MIFIHKVYLLVLGTDHDDVKVLKQLLNRTTNNRKSQISRNFNGKKRSRRTNNRNVHTRIYTYI